MRSRIKIKNYTFILSEDIWTVLVFAFGTFAIIKGIISKEVLTVGIGSFFALGSTTIIFILSKPRNCEKCNNKTMERIPINESLLQNDVYRKNFKYKCSSCGNVRLTGLRLG